MKGYASNTRTKRNLEAMQRHDWSILLAPDNPKPPEGFKFGLDNGAWGAHQKQQPFDEKAFMNVLEPHGAAADFVVIPDIVAGGMKSLEFSLSWLDRLKHLKKILLPLQDGMDIKSVSSVLESHPKMGLFLGGTTEWKIATMMQWGSVAHAKSRHYHVGRVNSRRRIRLAAEAGADSIDGTSPTMYSCMLPRLDAQLRQANLFGRIHIA